MHRTYTQTLILMLLMLAAQGILHARQTHHSMPVHHTSDAPTQSVATYSCPMHPDVVSDKPGTCPKCGMTLVKGGPGQSGREKSSVAANIKKAKNLLLTAKHQLVTEGKYDCCIEDGCKECILDEQECTCHDDMKDGEAVCNECWTGWQRGEGKDKSVDPQSVKTSFTGHDHH